MSTFKVGGLRFVKAGPVCLSFCVSRKPNLTALALKRCRALARRYR